MLTAFQALNPAWKQKDFERALLTAQSHISHVRRNDDPAQFSRQVCALLRYRIRDRLAEILGPGYAYAHVAEVADWYIRLHAEPEYFSKEVDAEMADNKAYQAAFKIFTSGYWII